MLFKIYWIVSVIHNDIFFKTPTVMNTKLYFSNYWKILKRHHSYDLYLKTKAYFYNILSCNP